MASSEHLAPFVGNSIAVHKLSTMHSHQQRPSVVGHGHLSDRQPPPYEQVDGRTMSEFASDTGTRCYANPPLMEPPRNPLASTIERAPRDQIPYEDIVSMMKEQAERIRELEHNIEEMRGVGE